MINKINNFNKKQTVASGYSIIELLFYIGIFSVLSIVVINSILTMTKAFKETTIQAELAQSSAIIERISREVKQASSVATISATNLRINTTDNGGAAKTVEFTLSGTDIQLLENSVLTGNLNTPNISVTGLTFTQITNTSGVGVKIALTVVSDNDALARATHFYSTVILRDSY